MSIEKSALTINEILPEKFTKLNWNIIPPTFGRNEAEAAQYALGKVIDRLGCQSASEQGLSNVITSLTSLRAFCNHILYLLKDSEANEGCGEVVGFLKIGSKHLFLYDESNKLFEVDPVCVLDFYVVSNRQRQGYGRALFEHMLKDMDVKLTDLAFDSPSEKMQKFLSGVYGIKNLVQQNNSFTVVPGFFDQLKSGTRKIHTGPAKDRQMANAFTRPVTLRRHKNPESPDYRVRSTGKRQMPNSNICSVKSIMEDKPGNPNCSFTPGSSCTSWELKRKNN